ncbi:MAG: alpha/beta hydrolase [Acidimicrobiaceae bacterium]|nr:alpha/beta hydrolase [Acidimicrobiaceae bacterium]
MTPQGAPLIVEVAGGPVEVGVEPGPDPPLVFLHEGLGSLGLWRSFPDDVRDATGGLATVVFSRHGYGSSGPAQLPRTVTYMHHEADVVLPDLLARLGVQRPVLVGHSDGASIALLYAGNAAHGAAIAGLVLLAPHVFVEATSVQGIRAARAAYQHGELRERLARHHADVDGAFWGWNDIWLSPEFRSWNICDRLRDITCPVLVIQGEADAYGTPAQLDAIEAGVAGPVTTVLLPGVGHAPHLEAADATLEAVTRFVRRL